MNEDQRELLDLSARAREWEDSLIKPTWLTPLAVHIITRLIWAGADNHPVRHSHASFAESGCASTKTVARTLDQLANPPKPAAFVTLAHNRGGSSDIGLTREYRRYLNQPTVADDTAIALAGRYIKWQSKNVNNMSKMQRRRFRRKGYADQQIETARLLLAKPGVDFDYLIRLLNFAAASPKWFKRAVGSLYSVRRDWRRLNYEFRKSGVSNDNLGTDRHSNTIHSSSDSDNGRTTIPGYGQS